MLRHVNGCKTNSLYRFGVIDMQLHDILRKQNSDYTFIPEKTVMCFLLFLTTGIQTAVRMLEQTLRNPNIYRDSKPRLDSIQTPYREMKKRIKELPPLRPIKKPAHRAEELIKEIKESTTVKVVALGSAIHSRGVNKEDYKEALFLLRDMKKKQKMLHEKTMEQEARVRFEQSTAEHPPF
ncbi:hypothetical protein ATANTOWER_020641 [Ataeniobius toweri]|uniref:Uncharacterized protein n=1 Tax=Ataeniobius toweri TaxID=208326 RepID=A0ABU7B185_9TELE|nr:hypothetical protein [Ataeniobius toweri]